MKIGDRLIGPEHPPYIIAECCNNFNNDFKAAKRMIAVADRCGVDAVKFQLRSRPDRLSVREHIALKDYCEEVGITWLCTGFDKYDVDVLASLDVPAFKIGSAEVVDDDFVSYVFSVAENKPVMMSLGAATLEVLNYAQPNAIPLQCTSIYPTPYDKVDLCVLSDLWRRFDCYGLSCHTPTIWTAIGAVALGASVIEKHFTLDRTQPGPDQTSSLLPVEMVELVLASHAVWKARGGAKKIYPEELEKMKAFRGAV